MGEIQFFLSSCLGVVAMAMSALSARANALKLSLPCPHQTLSTCHMPAAGLYLGELLFCPSDSALNVVLNPAISFPGQRELYLFRASDSSVGLSLGLHHPHPHPLRHPAQYHCNWFVWLPVFIKGKQEAWSPQAFTSLPMDLTTVGTANTGMWRSLGVK